MFCKHLLLRSLIFKVFFFAFQCMDKRASSVSSQAQADAGDEMEVPNEIADQEQTE